MALTMPTGTRTAPPINGKKICAKCGKEKPIEDFYRERSPCKACRYLAANAWRLRNLEKVAAQTRAWHKRNPERSSDMYRRRKYKNLDWGDFDRMLKEQDGKCAICGETDPRGRGGFHVDHCHKTEKIRAILCHNCNLGIGNLQHDPRILRAALEYLLKHSDE